MQAGTPAKQGANEPERLLALDLDAANLRLLTAACEQLGVKVIATSWPLAEALLHEAFCMIVVDACSDAARATAQLRELQARPRTALAPCVAFCSGFDAPGVAQLIGAGTDELIAPNCELSELVCRLRLQLQTRVSNARIARRERALSVMLEITQALVSSIDIQEILFTVVRRIADVVRVDRVSIVLVPDDTTSTHGYVVAASDDAALSYLRLDLDKYPEIRHVLLHKTPFTVNDAGTHPILDGVRSSVVELGLGALTLIPMVFEGRVMGVLFLRALHKQGALDEQQIGFCEVLANATAIALHNARILQTLHAGQTDRSSRLEAEKRLSLLKRYADVFESAADGIAALDEEAQLLYANPSAYRMLAIQERDMPIGGPVARIVVPADRRRLAQLKRDIERGRFPHNFDLRVQKGDGQQIAISCSFSRLHSQDSAVLLSFRDVTEARKMQEELVHTRNFLQSLIDASVDAIVAADMRGKIILFNEGAQRLYGHKPEDVVNKMHVRELYPGEGAREVGRMLQSRARGGVGRLEPVRMEAIDMHGNVFPISLTAATIYENGVPSATFGIFADLRDRVRVEEQLAQAQEKLALSEKQALLAELAGATAHELNQPLTSVMGYAELLMRKVEPDQPAFRAATVIQSEAQRMAEIVRKIGKLTRYETKSYVGEQRILDLDRASEDEPKSGSGSST